MSLANEFVLRRMLVFKCFNCQHPAMQIVGKNELEKNPDDSIRYEVTLRCPRCKKEDKFILNDGQVDVASESDQASVVPKLERVL